MSIAIHRVVLAVGFLLAPQASAQQWTEYDDAWSFPDGMTQVIRGIGLSSVTGSTAAEDLRDAYCIKIIDPSRFLATTDSTVAATASANFDTRLFLLRLDGAPVLANDDSPSGASAQSTLTGISTDGSGFTLSQPGEYVLVVGGSADVPRDTSDVGLFNIPSDPIAVHAANPTAGRFGYWEGEDPATGIYTVAVSGVLPCQNDLDVISERGAFLGDGTGTFYRSDIFQPPIREAAQGYIDGDQHLDVVVTTWDDFRTCLGGGAGNFACSIVGHEGGSFTGSVGLSFIDADEHLDIVLANDSHVTTNQICLGDGAGGFSCKNLSDDENRTRAVAIGFIDCDQYLDAVFANLNQRNRVCFGDGTGEFSCSYISSEELWSEGVALGYVDGDQHLDVVFANFDRRNRVCLGDGNGGFACRQVSTDAFESADVKLGFVNGDPNLDAVFANSYDAEGLNRVCLGDGLGGFNCNDLGTGNSDRVSLGYINNDHNLDVIFGWTADRVCLGSVEGEFVCGDPGPSFSGEAMALGEFGILSIFSDGFESGDTSAWMLAGPEIKGSRRPAHDAHWQRSNSPSWPTRRRSQSPPPATY